MSGSKTIYDKIWDDHLINTNDDGTAFFTNIPNNSLNDLEATFYPTYLDALLHNYIPCYNIVYGLTDT